MQRRRWYTLLKRSVGNDQWKGNLPKSSKMISRWANGRTSRHMEDLASAPTRLLVANDEGLCQRICGGMCDLLTEQNDHAMQSTALAAYWSRRNTTAICHNVSRFHGQTPTIKRERLDPHGHRPGMHQSGHSSTLLEGCGSWSDCQFIQGTYISLYRNSDKAYFGSRYTLHILIVQETVPSSGDKPKYEHSISSTDQLTV